MVQVPLIRWAIGWQMTEEEFGLRLTSHKYPKTVGSQFGEHRDGEARNMYARGNA
jgi:hypothetical protein